MMSFSSPTMPDWSAAVVGIGFLFLVLDEVVQVDAPFVEDGAEFVEDFGAAFDAAFGVAAGD